VGSNPTATALTWSDARVPIGRGPGITLGGLSSGLIKCQERGAWETNDGGACHVLVTCGWA
jgi:hypothetical protein